MSDVQPTSSRTMLWIGLVVLAVVAIVLVSRARQSAEKIPWRTDYTAGMAEAKAAGKPVLLDFSASWCGPCQEMKRTTWSDQSVADAVRGDIPISIDGDQRRDLVAMYHVEAYPTMILLSPTGTPLKDLTGAVDPEGFLHWLNFPASP